jgi:hypothetical protein
VCLLQSQGLHKAIASISVAGSESKHLAVLGDCAFMIALLNQRMGQVAMHFDVAGRCTSTLQGMSLDTLPLRF